jgi:hypothetical protein
MNIVMTAPPSRPSSSLSSLAAQGPRTTAGRSRALSWVGLAVLWGISAALLVLGARAVVALGV